MSDRKRNRALIDSDSDDSDGSANLDDVSENFLSCLHRIDDFTTF